MNITSMAKKNLSRSDLAQHVLHRNYEFHTGTINRFSYEISINSLKNQMTSQKNFYSIRSRLRISLRNNIWRLAVGAFFCQLFVFQATVSTNCYLLDRFERCHQLAGFFYYLFDFRRFGILVESNTC